MLQSDRTTPCTAVLPLPSSVPRVDAKHSASRPNPETSQCVINFLGSEINTASFAMYTFSISVLLQALLVITMSGAADHGRYRKTLLLVFGFAGAIATMLFLAATSRVYLLGALWAIIGNVCFGASFVLLNSFLPLLVRWHPSVQETDPAESESSFIVEDDSMGSDLRRSFSNEDDEVLGSTAALLPATDPTPYPASRSAPSPELQLSTKISSYGIGIGYLAAVFVQCLAIFIVVMTGSSTFSLRLVLFVVGLWWFVFTLPVAYCLRPRPGPPLSAHGEERSWFGYVTYSWGNLARTITRARRLKDVLLFLAAWFMISDAIATVSGTAVLFAKTTLAMRPAALALINVIATISGVIGAFTWSKLSQMMGLAPSQTILACICLFEVIPIYGLLGYIPAVQRWGVIGLQQPWEMYPLGAVYGFVLGGLSSYCRSLFGELIPEGSEAAFYALYAVTDKGSSVFGPAIVGAITDATGEIRPAFWFLAVLIGLPIPLMSLVNVERGKREGAKLAREFVPIAQDEDPDLVHGGEESHDQALDRTE